MLAADPNSVTGLYLRGVISFKQDQISQSKTAFERVKELLVDHGPTLNNLGVIMSRQRQPVGALAFYDLAMLAMPKTRQILDNTAEALNLLTDSQRDTTTAKKAAKHFIEQDAELQKDLAGDGLYRWGATWLTQAQMDQVKAAEEKIKAKRNALQQDYDRVAQRLADGQRRFDANEITMRQLMTDRTYVANGQVVQLQPPAIYYDLRRENVRLRNEALDLASRLDGLRDKIRAVQQENPHPQFSGMQRLIEAEGTPLPVAKSPTTQKAQ